MIDGGESNGRLSCAHTPTPSKPPQTTQQIDRAAEACHIALTVP